jgi:hypothetical protein
MDGNIYAAIMILCGIIAFFIGQYAETKKWKITKLF